MLLDEDIMSLAEASKRLPRVDGRRPHASTIWRWARRGVSVRGPDGERVRIYLETRRLGPKVVTSAEALERFSERLAAVELPELTRPPTFPRRPRKRAEKEIADAEKRLAAKGA